MKTHSNFYICTKEDEICTKEEDLNVNKLNGQLEKTAVKILVKHKRQGTLPNYIATSYRVQRLLETLSK